MTANGKPKKPPRGAEPLDSLGETWWLSIITPELRREFAAPIRAKARQALFDDKPTMSEEQYAEEKESLQARIDAGAYEWGPPVELGGTGPGKAIKAVLDTGKGQITLMQLLLRETHDEVPLNKVEEIIDGNPEGFVAALRAVSGLPPLPPETTEEPGEKTTTETTTQKKEQATASAPA